MRRHRPFRLPVRELVSELVRIEDALREGQDESWKGAPQLTPSQRWALLLRRAELYHELRGRRAAWDDPLARGRSAARHARGLGPWGRRGR